MPDVVAKRSGINWTIGYPPHPVTGERLPNARQRLAEYCKAQVLFYGGARGGGKTEFLGVEAGTHAMKYPGIQMLLVRRTREEMKLQILPVLKRIFGPLANWKEQRHQFVFFNGSVLSVEFIERQSQIGRYLGAEFGWIGVDQAEQLAEWAVMGLLSCLRSTKPWPKTMRLTGNPGIGVGVPWLRRWFVVPTEADLGERPPPQPLQSWRPLPGPNDPTPIGDVPTRCFIPARFQDNSALVAAQPNYLGQIYQAFTPEIARAQAEGDWDASDATIVGSLWARSKTVDAALLAKYPDVYRLGQSVQWHVIQNNRWRPPRGALIYGSVDYGISSPWSFHLHAVMPGGRTRTFYELYQTKLNDTQQARLIKEALHAVTYDDARTPVLEGLQWIVYDPSMKAARAEHILAKSIIENYQDIVSEAQFLSGAGGAQARLSRPGRWLDALATAPDGLPWWCVTTACPDLIRTVPEVPWDPIRRNVEDDDSENHCYEDVGRFFEARPHQPRVTPPDPYAHLDQVSADHHRAVDAQHAKPKGGHLGGLARR